MKKLQFIDIGKPFRIIGKICKDIERAFRFKGINVNFIGYAKAVSYNKKCNFVLWFVFGQVTSASTFITARSSQ